MVVFFFIPIIIGIAVGIGLSFGIAGAVSGILHLVAMIFVSLIIGGIVVAIKNRLVELAGLTVLMGLWLPFFLGWLTWSGF